MEKVKTRKWLFGKLRWQLTVIIILFYIILMVLEIISIYYSSTNSYLVAKNDMIERNLFRIKDNYVTFDGFDWFLDYWEKNYEKINTEFTREEMEITGEFLLYSDNGNFDPSYIESLAPEVQLALAKEQYLIFKNGLIYEMSEFKYGSVFCIDISEENRGFLICEANPEGGDKHRLGERWEYPLSGHSAAAAFLSDDHEEIEFEKASDSELDGKRYYVGCLPVLEKDGKAQVLLCLGYNWEGFYSELIGDIKIIAAAMLAGVLMIILIMVLIIDSLASEPLRILKEAVREYSVDHDSEKIQKQLSAIRSVNEIGELAEHFIDLAEETERSSEGRRDKQSAEKEDDNS